MVKEDTLLRSWRQGTAQHPGFLEDHASFGLALLALYQSDHDVQWFTAAKKLTQQIKEKFLGADGSFYDSPVGDTLLITRAQNLQDNAVPSGNSQAIKLLLQMAGFEGQGKYYDIASHTLKANLGQITQYPGAFSNWLGAYDLILHPMKEIAIIGKTDDDTVTAMKDMLWLEFRPNLILAIGNGNESEQPSLLNDRKQLDNKATAYVCFQHTCQNPVNTLPDLSQLL